LHFSPDDLQEVPGTWPNPPTLALLNKAKPSMWQITDNLFVGRYRDTVNLALLRAHDIEAMLQLAARIEQPGIEVLYLDVEDGEPLPAEKLRQGVSFVRDQFAAGRRVLIACGAGISRSVTFAIAVLHEEEGISLLNAFHDIHSIHPDALPHYRLWHSLCEYYHEKVPLERLWDVR
jgi:protein-tyrosine phosphatase